MTPAAVGVDHDCVVCRLLMWSKRRCEACSKSVGVPRGVLLRDPSSSEEMAGLEAPLNGLPRMTVIVSGDFDECVTSVEHTLHVNVAVSLDPLDLL